MVNVLKTVTSAIKHWYLPLIVGVLFILFWIYIFTVPKGAYITLAILFSISFIVSWVFEIFFSVQNKKDLDSRGWYLAGWILGLVIWIILLVYPETALVSLPFVVWFVLLFKSIQLMWIAFDLKRFHIMSWWNLAIASLVWIVISVLLLLNPVFTWISLVILTALGFIVSWISLVILSFNLKKIKDLPKKAKKAIEEAIDEVLDEDDD